MRRLLDLHRRDRDTSEGEAERLSIELFAAQTCYLIVDGYCDDIPTTYTLTVSAE